MPREKRWLYQEDAIREVKERGNNVMRGQKEGLPAEGEVSQFHWYYGKSLEFED